MHALRAHSQAAALVAALFAVVACSGGGSGGSAPLGFDVTLSQSSLILVVGNAGDVDVNIIPSGGFTGDVTLSLVGVPSGITGTLTPFLIPAAAGASRLHVSVAPTTAPGDYPFTVRGESGELVVDRPLTVTVVFLPPQRFSLTPDLETLVAPPGTSRRTTIDVSPIGGFADTVSLTTVGLPTGITAAFDPAAIPGGSGRTELTVTVAASVSLDAHVITVRGTGGTYTEDRLLAILVPPAPAASGLTLTAAPYASVAAGQATAVQIGVSRAPGVVGGVDLSLLGLPAGLSGSFSETPCVTAGSLLTLQAASQLAPGLYPLTVQGVCGASSGTVGLLVEVGPATQPADVWISRVELAQTFLDRDPRLVPGKPALLRAHVLADAASVTGPRVLVTAFQGTATLGTLVLSGPTTLPTREEVSTLALGFTGTLAAAWVVDGLELKFEVDPDQTLTERNELNNKVRVAPAVARPTALDLVIVPIILDGRTGTPPALYDTLYRQWPFRDVVIGVRQAYQVTSVTKVYSNGDGWSSVLAEIAALRQADNATANYYGVIKTDYGSGVAGMGYIGYPVAVGMDSSASVAAHELGHNFGLRHAPCGNVTGVDASYPYPGGAIGSWGYNLGTAQLYSPVSYKDLMGYCNPTWVSDYNYRKVHATMEPAAMRAAAAGPARPALIVSGTIDAQGEMHLLPILPVHRPVPVHTGGDHWLVLDSSAGRTAFPFSPALVGCGPQAGREGYFSLVVPDPGPLERLSVEQGTRVRLDRRMPDSRTLAAAPAAVSLTERSGRLELRWNAAVFPHASVIHVGDRRTTLGLFLPGGEATMSTRGVPAGGGFEVILSRDLAAKRILCAR